MSCDGGNLNFINTIKTYAQNRTGNIPAKFSLKLFGSFREKIFSNNSQKAVYQVISCMLTLISDLKRKINL